MMNDIKWNSDQLYTYTYGNLKIKTDGHVSIKGGVLTVTNTNGLSLNDYQTGAASTAIYPESANILYPALGLAGEAGEVAGKIKKVIRDNNGVFTDELKAKIADELGDVTWYCAALARDLGYTLEEICQKNLNKLADRKARNVLGGSGDNR